MYVSIMNLITGKKMVLHLHCAFDAKKMTNKNMAITYTSLLQHLLPILDHYGQDKMYEGYIVG